MTAPDLSVVVLCYRSGQDLVPFVERLHGLLSLMSVSWEIILVGNYNPDDEDETPDVVRAIESRLPHVRSIVKVKEGMCGWDMRSGLVECLGAHLAVIDGDGQFPLESIVTCYVRARLEGWDLVQTYRVRREDGIIRKLISWWFNRLVRVLFPEITVRDINSKPKILSRRLYDALRLTDDGWFIDAEIVLQAKLMGVEIAYEPIHFYSLKGRHSFVKPTAILEFIGKLWTFKRRLPAYRKLFAPLRDKAALP